jgi:hypothetical protein
LAATDRHGGQHAAHHKGTIVVANMIGLILEQKTGGAGLTIAVQLGDQIGNAGQILTLLSLILGKGRAVQAGQQQQAKGEQQEFESGRLVGRGKMGRHRATFLGRKNGITPLSV